MGLCALPACNLEGSPKDLGAYKFCHDAGYGTAKGCLRGEVYEGISRLETGQICPVWESFCSQGPVDRPAFTSLCR